jgi:hypothetical protein
MSLPLDPDRGYATRFAVPECTCKYLQVLWRRRNALL